MGWIKMKKLAVMFMAVFLSFLLPRALADNEPLDELINAVIHQEYSDKHLWFLYRAGR